jgi:hypothetical protein
MSTNPFEPPKEVGTARSQWSWANLFQLSCMGSLAFAAICFAASRVLEARDGDALDVTIGRSLEYAQVAAWVAALFCAVAWFLVRRN